MALGRRSSNEFSVTSLEGRSLLNGHLRLKVRDVVPMVAHLRHCVASVAEAWASSSLGGLAALGFEDAEVGGQQVATGAGSFFTGD